MLREDDYEGFEPDDNDNEFVFDSNKIQVFVERLAEAVDRVIEIKKINLSIVNYSLPVDESYVITAGLMDHIEDSAMEYFISRNSKKIISIYPKSAATAQDYDKNYKIREFYIKGETYRVKIFLKNLEFFNINEFHLNHITQTVLETVGTEVEYLDLHQLENEEVFQELRKVLNTGEDKIKTSVAPSPQIEELDLSEFELDNDQEITNFAYELRDISELCISKNNFQISSRETKIFKNDIYTLLIEKQSSNPNIYIYSIRKEKKLLVQLVKKDHPQKFDSPTPETSIEVDLPEAGLYLISFYENGEQEIENLKEFLGTFREAILLQEPMTSETASLQNTEDIKVPKEEVDTTVKWLWYLIKKRFRGGSK